MTDTVLNTKPIFSSAPQINWCSLTAANTAKDGTGTVGTVFTAHATKGGRVEKLRVRPLGTNVITVARVFINNGSTSATAANNSLFTEITLAATTVSEVAAQTEVEYTLNLALPAGYKLLVTLGTAVAAGHQFTAVGGEY